VSATPHDHHAAGGLTDVRKRAVVDPPMRTSAIPRGALTAAVGSVSRPRRHGRHESRGGAAALVRRERFVPVAEPPGQECLPLRARAERAMLVGTEAAEAIRGPAVMRE